MTVLVGLDLAWTPHRETGVCVLDDHDGNVRLWKLHCSISSPACFARMCESFGEDVVVAVDAPLLVEPGRCAEAELGKVYGSKHAGAYSANLAFLQAMNGMAGPSLARELVLRGFELDPEKLAAGTRGRFALEVFPHPAHVELFGLAMAMKYKKGLVAERKAALLAYQLHLKALLAQAMPLVLESPLSKAVLDPAATLARGKALKNLEDRLDALTCAYVAYHCWNRGPAGFSVFGSAAPGCIVVPRAGGV